MRSRRHSRTAPYIFVAPYVAFLVFFAVGPAVLGIVTSFWRDNAVEPPGFAGLDNWSATLTDARLQPAVANVATFTAAWLPALLIITVGLALLLNARANRTSTGLRFIYYLPGAVVGSAAALLWLFMATPQTSPFAPLLRALEVDTLGDALDGRNMAVLLAVMGVAIHAGGWIVVLCGGLAALPRDVMEAAAIDGCSAWQLAWRIKLPLVRRYLVLISISTFAHATQVFVEPQVLGAGVPGRVSPTWSINQLAWSYASDEGDFGKAAALSIALLLVGLAAAALLTTRTGFYRIDAEAARKDR